MSLTQDYEMERKLLGDKTMKRLDDYFHATGKDYAQTVYSKEGWDNFEKWTSSNKEK